MAEIRWSLAAERDLRLLEEFISRGSHLRAVAFVDRLIQATESLEMNPQLGRVVPEFEQPELREIIFRGYRIVYALRGTDLNVLRVVHGARDLRALVQREPWELS